MGVIQEDRTAFCDHAPAAGLPMCEVCLRGTIGGRVFERIDVIARRSEPTLIQGETGTGKSVLADYLHARSRRATKPIQRRACGNFTADTATAVLFGAVAGAFTDARDRAGIVETLDGGTLVLDDIDYMPMEAQRTLLGFLDDGRYFRVGESGAAHTSDVRVIATSNKDLALMSERHQFLPDLLARLDCFTIRVPPLRERPDAIIRITNRILVTSERATGLRWRLSEGAEEALRRHSWRHNIRELKKVIGNVTAFARSGGGIVTAEDVATTLRDLAADTGAPPDRVRSFDEDSRMTAERSTRERVYRALCECDGNVTRAARLARVSRTTIYKMIHTNGWNTSRD